MATPATRTIAPGNLIRLLLGTAIAAALASCGGDGSSTTSVKSPQPKAGSSAAAQCRTGDLRVRLRKGSAATGHIETPFLIRNLAAGHCTMQGFPRITLLGKGGQPLPTKVSPASVDFFPKVPDRVVAVPRGGLASFRLVSNNPGQSIADCPRGRQLRVALPQYPQTQTLQFPVLACPGTMTVSRVAEGRSAYLGG